MNRFAYWLLAGLLLGGLCLIGLLLAATYRARTQQVADDGPAINEERVPDIAAKETIPTKEQNERARAEAMWIVFAAPNQGTNSLVSDDVLDAATFALCAEWRNGSPTVPLYVSGSFYGTQVASQPLCSVERRVGALKHLHDLASRGRTDAAVVLAYARYSESDQAMFNRQESLKWAKIAAAAESTTVIYLMGLQYLSGGAVPKDDAEALRWFERAAKRDDIRAQRELCELKRVINIVDSYAWCSVAASNPAQGEGANRLRWEAALSRDYKAKDLMSPDQVSRGQRIAAQRHAALEQIRSH